MHWNDRRNPNCLWPIAPEMVTEYSELELELQARGVQYKRDGYNWLTVKYLNVFRWPSREGTYVCAIGHQYAERRHDGRHSAFTSAAKMAEFLVGLTP